LINPILPAAAVDVRNKLGNAQNAGIYDFIPAAAIEKQINVPINHPCVIVTKTKNTAPITTGETLCQRRSCRLSDDQPTNN
jgi:hypothetical protein